MEGEVLGSQRDGSPWRCGLEVARSPVAEEAQEQHQWVDTLVQSLPGFDVELLELFNTNQSLMEVIYKQFWWTKLQPL